MIYEHKIQMDNIYGDTTDVTVEFEADKPGGRNPDIKGIYYFESDEPLDSEDIVYLFEWLERDAGQWKLISHNIT